MNLYREERLIFPLPSSKILPHPSSPGTNILFKRLLNNLMFLNKIRAAVSSFNSTTLLSNLVLATVFDGRRW